VNRDFRPLPLLGNPHVQTILGTLLRPADLGLPYRELHVHLPDGDRLLIYDSQPPRWRPGDAIALLVHGLAGSCRSGYMLRLNRWLWPHGYRVVRMNLRGAGRGLRWARRTYNAACSDDVRTVAEVLQQWSPTSSLVLVGFSLGGNIVFKLAGEAKDRPLPGLRAVAGLSPPVDLEACSALLASPANRVYDRFFADSLVTIIRRHQTYFPDLPRVAFPRELTLRAFDDLHTAPRGGFADSTDYYRRASAWPLFSQIAVPTLILTARDDPFIATEPLLALAARADLDVRILPGGGHLGFLGLDGNGGIRWAERRMADWILGTVPPRG
jgi:predicted alpha/beta-fold hydrolase